MIVRKNRTVEGKGNRQKKSNDMFQQLENVTCDFGLSLRIDGKCKHEPRMPRFRNAPKAWQIGPSVPIDIHLLSLTYQSTSNVVDFHQDVPVIREISRFFHLVRSQGPEKCPTAAGVVGTLEVAMKKLK